MNRRAQHNRVEFGQNPQVQFAIAPIVTHEHTVLTHTVHTHTHTHTHSTDCRVELGQNPQVQFEIAPIATQTHNTQAQRVRNRVEKS